MKSVITTVLLLASLKTLAHGEDKLGPNKGYLKMPGGFHTEVVPNKDGSIKVYLLDIEFKNPTVKDSKVEAMIHSSSMKNLTCTPKRDHFVCDTNKADLKNGMLMIIAERNSVKGAEANYDLPLTLAKPGTEMKMKDEDHGSHH